MFSNIGESLHWGLSKISDNKCDTVVKLIHKELLINHKLLQQNQGGNSIDQDAKQKKNHKIMYFNAENMKW